MRRLLRPAPLDWESPGAIVEPDPPPGPVDVIVPVYGAAAALAVCLASLRRATDFGRYRRHRLVLVLDGPQPAEVEAALAVLSDLPAAALLVLRNPVNRGFVASANLGLAASERDVVLLNSDTEVAAGWLEGLQAAAYSAPSVATATPFSNDATLCSLPRPFAANALPAGWDTAGFAALVARVATRSYPRLPTGVGFCLYIKRRALANVGLLDEARFGQGYGEENDFCLRALAAGWRHVLADATFVFHAGRASFGAAREARVRAAHRALARRHPAYLPTIADFLRRDPLRPARERVLAALRPPPGTSRRPGTPRRVLHLVHGWPPWSPAGTEVYARGLALCQAERREVAVYARRSSFAGAGGAGQGEAVELLDGGVRVRLMVNDFTARNPLARNALHDRALTADFARLLAEVAPDLVHVHHLSGHAAGLLGAVPRRLPIVYQLQDWWAPCARANLLDAGRRLCPGPAAGRCARCLPLTGLPPAALWNRALHLYRRRLLCRTLGRADALVCGSRAIAESHRALGFLPAGVPLHILPYGVETAPARPRRAARRPLRVGYIGSILPHKGVHVAVAAFAGVAPERAGLTLWGDPAISPAYTAELEALAAGAPGSNIRFAGRFAEEDKPAVLAGLDLLLVPSLGLESFGLVAREAFHHGVPVLASRRGALADLFAEGVCGALVEPGDIAAWRGWIERLAADPGQIERWRQAAPPVHSLANHAEEIEAVYAEVLARRPPPRGAVSGGPLSW
jgi:glycosyltransferase involved in cell wall biosynthesis